MNNIRIVPMTADHLDEVAELERICFTTPWSRNMLVEELQNDCAAFLVALQPEKLTGRLGKFLCPMLLLLVGAAVVAWGQNDFAEAFTISLACLSNIGPAMGSIGPVGDFSSLTEVSKLMMILWMLLGRLELMPILVMLSPGTWKER